MSALNIIEDQLTETPLNKVKVTQLIDNRYPMNPYPIGWYVVANSHEIKKGKLKNVHYFGQDLVIFRGENGGISVIDPTCPHLGAHLGKGGCVKGNHIRCAFHGWEYDQKGICRNIPYSTRIPQKARVNTWHSAEGQGLIFVYYHPNKLSPEDAPPFMPELDSTEWSRLSMGRLLKVKVHVQELAENTVDTAHFGELHSMGVPCNMEIEYGKTRANIKQELHYNRFGLNLKYFLHVEQVRLGNVINRVSWGKVRFISLISNTPIDEEYIHTRMAVSYRMRFNFLNKWILGPLSNLYIRHEFKKDIPIWREKAYHVKPMLCHADGPIPQLRAWAKQFY